MIDNRKKFVNIKEEEKNLKSRNLVNYSDNSQNSFLGFEKIIYHPEKIVGVKQRNNAFPISATISLEITVIMLAFMVLNSLLAKRRFKINRFQ